MHDPYFGTAKSSPGRLYTHDNYDVSCIWCLPDWWAVVSGYEFPMFCLHLQRWLLQLFFLKFWRLTVSCVLIVPGTFLLRCLPGFSLAVVLLGLWLVDVLPLAIPDWLPIFLFLSAGNHVLFSFRLSSFFYWNCFHVHEFLSIPCVVLHNSVKC